MGLTGKGLYSLWGKGCAGEPFPCCSMDPLSAMEANSTAVMGMACSSVGLLDSALPKWESCALSLFHFTGDAF